MERMRAGLRLGLACSAAALALSPAPAFAQEVPPATTNTPAADAVGPRELQDFSLKGTVTQRSDRPVQPLPGLTPRGSRNPPQVGSSTQPSTPAPAPPRTAAARPRSNPAETTTAQTPERSTALAQSERQAAPAPATAEPSATALSAPQPVSTPTVTSAAAVTPGFAPEPTTGDLAPERSFSLIPWLLAALALGAGGAFLFWRNRSRPAFAGGPQIDAFTAPEPTPAPRPAPPRAAPPPTRTLPPSSPGIVSTRLRPWIDLGLQPMRCVLDDEKVTIEFEIELFNSGSAPARAVLVEASLFNAGPEQEQEVSAFFADPVGAGDRIVAIAPLKRITVRTHVAIGRDQVQAYEAAGKQVFLPVIAFNALYRWSGGEGQTSASYLLGRDTDGDKMAPFRLDLGPRVFRGVGARLLPTGLRR